MDSPGKICQGFALKRVLDCIADPTKNRATAQFMSDISPVFPYLNAVLRGIQFNPSSNSVTIKREGRLLTFYARGAVMAKVNGAQDALAQLQWFCELCNEIWARRDAIEPDFQQRAVVGPLDIYRLLPQLNCQACGERTCMAFAFGMLLGTRNAAECTHLQTPEYAENARRLDELV
ncbi:MAG: (Fe-S)-binding protein, partial [Anaerolineae bacterium]